MENIVYTIMKSHPNNTSVTLHGIFLSTKEAQETGEKNFGPGVWVGGDWHIAKIKLLK